MEKIGVTIIGAGAVGLAVGMELSETSDDLFIIERNDSFGRETSSRNSEVIHAGIYYPKNSLKARTCVEGRALLYAFCAKNNIPHKKIGKLIAASDKKEAAGLEELFKNGLENGVDDLKLLSREEVKKMEPNVRAVAAIYSPSSGIIDTHSFMKSMAARINANNGQIAYDSEVVAIDRIKAGFEITIKDQGRESFKFSTGTLINCAGLNSDKIAAMAGIAKSEYSLKYCKGSYFRVGQNKARLIKRLVYPLPEKYRTGLGIHATLDLAGGMRLGPDAEYVNEINYNIDEARRDAFCESIRKMLPFIEVRDLSPDTAGVRPKLQGPGEDFRDFIIKEESDSDLPSLINLIGIESPGITASLSIAKMVRNITATFCA